MNVPLALTIAGSDSGGCAGIQADLKTFGALGVHGMSVIVSVTAQDTRRVYASADVPLDNIELQIQAVMEDIGTDAVKTGMLSSAPIIELVAQKLRHYGVSRLVVDPVMVTTGGDRLIKDDAIEVLKELLFPLATVVTPNLSEAEVLAVMPIRSTKEVREAAARIHALGPNAVVIKGGHFDESRSSVDLYYDGQQYREYVGPRFPTENTHGSGCTFASAVAAFLAKGLLLTEAIEQAKGFVSQAIRHSYNLGHGHGPLGHFFASWDFLKRDPGTKSVPPGTRSYKSRGK